MTLLVHPLYNFLKYDNHKPGYHTGWYMDLNENEVAVVDFDIRVLPDETYRVVLKQLRDSDSPIYFKIEEKEVIVYPNEANVIENILKCDSIDGKKSVIRDFIIRNVKGEYGPNDYTVITGSGGLHYYYKYKNVDYSQRNIKCIQTLFYEVDVLLGGPMHSFVVCPRTVAIKGGILGEYKSRCENFNEAFPTPYDIGVRVSDNIKRNTFKREYDDIPEEDMLTSYTHNNFITWDIIYKGRRYHKKRAENAVVKLPFPLNPLPEEILEFCSYSERNIIKDWEFMVSKPEKTSKTVMDHNKREFKQFLSNLIRRGVKIHCTAHPGSSYTSEVTLLHLLGAFSNFNDDMRAEFFKILLQNQKALTPNAYKNLRRPHKGVRMYSKYSLSRIVNYYTNVDAHFFF